MESSKEAESAQREGEFKAEILQPESKDPQELLGNVEEKSEFEETKMSEANQSTISVLMQNEYADKSF